MTELFPDGDGVAAAGPGPFGRSVVVDAGQEPPPAWAAAPRVVVDEAALAAPGATIAALRRAWAERQPAVIELAVDPARFREPDVLPGAPWELGVDVDCPHDALHFLVWANAWDARGLAPVWWWGVKAARLARGARPTPGGPADVMRSDGTALWVDGGPRQPFPGGLVEGFGVVHRESVELGRLAVAPAPAAPTADLADDQRAAVVHLRGPARVVAPAGSGKTRVLTERMRHLLVDRRWEPELVLAVAYNVKARDEMVARTAGLGARVQTLNGLAYGVLASREGGAPEVIDEREVRRLLDRLVPSRPHRANTDPVAPYIEALTAVRLGLRDPAEVEDERGDVPGLAGLVGPYRAELARRRVVDFDEQVCAAVEALLTDGELRRRVQARHRHVLVDEFQDLTPAHVVLLRLVAGPALDVFAVGDDDQVIYGHAGADPQFLIDFERWFPGGAAHALEVNHRSAAPIVEAAARLLSYNHRRVPKVILPRPGAATGRSAVRVVPHVPARGAAAVVHAVHEWLDEGVSADEVAVLTRVHALLLAPHVALVEAGVPVRSTVGPELLDRTGARAALAYLRIAVDPDGIDPGDLVEVYRRPSRGLPQWITKWFRRRMSLAELAALGSRMDDVKVAAKLGEMAAALALVVEAGRGTTRQALEVIRDDVGLGEAMAQLDRSKGGEGSSQLDDLEALLQVADLHPSPAGFEPWLRSCLSSHGGRSVGGVRGACVELSTVHRVKGREWSRVVVAGVTAGLLPHRLAVDEEEERRVLHVAITRARDQVVVFGDGSRMSPFLAELRGRARREAPASGPVPEVRRAGPPPRRVAAAAEAKAKDAAKPKPLAGEAAVREEALRAWRNGRSKADSVPAYIVASNATVRALAERPPSTLVEMGAIRGIGPAKLARYGGEILAVLAGEDVDAVLASVPGAAEADGGGAEPGPPGA